MARSLFLGLIVAACVFGQIGSAAEIVAHSLLMEGSSDPRGDLINAILLFEPGEDELVLEVQPFVLSGEEKETMMPVQARGANDGDDSQHVIVRRSVQRRPGPSPGTQNTVQFVAAELVVPYGEFALPRGEYHLAYEIRLRDAEDVVFALPTYRTLLEVGEPRPGSVRTFMCRTSKVIPEERICDAYAVVDGSLRKTSLGCEVFWPVSEMDTKDVPVDGTIRGDLHLDTPSGEYVALPTAPLSTFEEEQNRLIYYATNRNVADANATTPKRFGNKLGDRVVYGSCSVNIPLRSHVRGTLKLKTHWWQRRDPDKYFLVKGLNSFASDVFQHTLSDDILLFVHGYNTSFKEGVLRAAQLQHDIRFAGQCAAFSWPSQGSMARYEEDEKLNAASIEHMATTLELLFAAPRRHGKVHVVAHSMGTRLFLKAVRQLEVAGRLPHDRTAFGHVVLVAADVKPNVFAAVDQTVTKASDSVTYYYALNDLALGFSGILHGDRPAGLGAFVCPGMDTIDATRATSMVRDYRHGYYASSDLVLTDIRLVLKYGLPPARRMLEGPKDMLGFPIWYFRDPNTW